MHSVDKILRAGWEMLKNELGVFLNGTCQAGWRRRRAAVGVATKPKSKATAKRRRDAGVTHRVNSDAMKRGTAEAKRRRI